MNSSNTLPVRKRKRRLSLTTKKAISGWIFVLPFVLGIIMIYGPIVFKSIQISFVSLEGTASREVKEFIGFDNYKRIFEEGANFLEAIMNGIKSLVIQIPSIVIFSLLMAVILNQKMAGRTLFRAIFFLPVILSTGVIAATDASSNALANMESGQVDTNTGEAGFMSSMDLASMLGNIQMGSALVDIVVGLVNDIFDIISRSGVQMLIFLSGLQSISPSIYESCQMEGASAWETFWKITLPMISPMILVNAIYTVIDAFTAPDNNVMGYVQKLLRGGTSGTALGSPIEAVQVGHAMIWVYTALVLVVIVLVALIMKAFVFYQKRD